MGFSLSQPVGRLLEARLDATLTLEETTQFRTRMWAMLGAQTGRAVIIADLKRCERFAPEVEERLLAMLKHDTPKVERTAFIIRAGAFALQVERMIDEAQAAATAAGRPLLRRAFGDKQAAQAWLGEVLNPAERARLAEFVAAIS